MKQTEEKAKPLRRWTWLVCVLLAALVMYFIYSSKQQTLQSAANKQDTSSNPIVPVTTEPVTLGNMPVYLHGLGTVTGLRTVTVKSRVDGELMRVLYKEGALVQAGDLLAEIDPRNFQIQLMQAEGQLQRDEALLKNAELDLNRYKTLLAQDSIANQQVATQAALVKQHQGTVITDQALVANAKLQLSYSKITAPISGRLGLRLIDQGNIIKASDATGLAVITQIQPIAMVFTLPEDQLPILMPLLNSGQSLQVDAFDRSDKHKLAEGQLVAMDNQINISTGTVKLKSQFANTDGALFVNQFVNARLLIQTLTAVAIIPSAAVQNSEQGRFVYVLKNDDTVTVRLVKLGAVDGEKVAVLQGLTAQELIVLDNTDKLREGAKVKPISPTMRSDR